MNQNLSLRTSGGRGGLVVIALVVVIAALVIIGLILPPVALPSRLGLGFRTVICANPDSRSKPAGMDAYRRVARQ